MLTEGKQDVRPCELEIAHSLEKKIHVYACASCQRVCLLDFWLVVGEYEHQKWH